MKRVSAESALKVFAGSPLGLIRVIVGLYWGYNRRIVGYNRIMEKKMETTI